MRSDSVSARAMVLYLKMVGMLKCSKQGQAAKGSFESD